MPTDEDSRSVAPPRSAQVTIVGALFVLSGAWSAIEIVIALLRDQLNLNLGVLCIPIGIGVLRRRSWARGWAIAFLAFGIIVAIVLGVVVLTARGGGRLRIWGPGMESGHVGFSLAIIGTLLALLVWECAVLTSRRTRAEFEWHRRARDPENRDTARS